MSFDASGRRLLLSAKGLSKAYPADLSPQQRLILALFGRMPKSKAPHIVLRDVDLEIFEGQSVGIIGRNGAGKTTLLGLLGNVIEPTTGAVQRFCRVAVLLEIGANFNPEFTGRDNAALFCSIMGLSRATIEERLPAVAEFAELGEYFDMPLRTYSSGMQARLGFSCAIQVDAELIIIDETLAVGDVSFRQKCYEKIKAMQERGQTFLIVSHSPNLIANFCNRGIVLEKSRVAFDGPVLDALQCYKDIREEIEARKKGTPPAPTQPVDAPLSLRNVRFVEAGRGGVCKLHAELVASRPIERPFVSFGIRNQEGIAVCSQNSENCGRPLPSLAADESIRLELSFENRLLPGEYFMSVRLGRIAGDLHKTYATHHNIARLSVTAPHPSAGLADLGMALDFGGVQ